MSRKRGLGTQSLKNPQQARTARWPQLAIVGGVVLLVALVLILKHRGADTPVAVGSGAQATTALPEAVGQARAMATLPEAVDQAQATVELAQTEALVATPAVPDESPEELLAARQPAFAFFHSNNCVQCIKMMEVVARVCPEFEGSVELVDVNVYDRANARLLQLAQIHAIPTQIFFDREGKGQVILGAMTADHLREQLRVLAGVE